MFPQIQLLPGAIAEIFASVADTQTLTMNDRYGLMAAALDESLNEEETLAVNRILRSVVRGHITIVSA